jgi:uncharacterized protein (TIRG00374 family)
VKRFLLVMMLVGMTLLGVILYRTNLGEVWSRLRQLGLAGFGLILLVYLACAVAQTVSWLFTLRATPATPQWLYRLWTVWMVGFALEATTPLAGLGGEPVKAFLLKRHYGIRYREAAASLVLTRTTDLIGQAVFITVGFALMLRSGFLPGPYRLAAGSGLALMILLVTAAVAAQQQRTLGRLRRRLERGWLGGRRLSARAVAALDSLHDIDEHLAGYYSTERRRFAFSVSSAVADWFVGTLAIYFALRFLAHPVSAADAVVIESFLVLVRSTLFFVPADLGTQEGALALICGAVVGSVEVGVALSAIRRARDVIWICAGLAIGWAYHLTREDLARARLVPEAESGDG